MKERFFNNADSFVMAFDEEWEKIDCEDKKIKIEEVINNLSDHPFVNTNREMAFQIANFRIKTLGKFK
tara:strand:+ start:14462 stop:14665 length:204 start_codon:yes stop_codon:yes gene_type:complete